VFPKVAEGVTERLQAYQTEFNAVTKKAGAGGSASAAAATGSDELASAISALPKLQRRKKLLDTHMNIATALLKEIKSREVDAFFDLEQSVLQKQSLDKLAVANILGAPDAPPKGSVLDRLRFLLIYYLQNGINDEQLASYKAQLLGAAQVASADPASSSNLEQYLSAVDYIVQHKFLHRLSAGDEMGSAASAAPKPVAQASGMLGNFTKLADQLYGGGVGLLAGVRNLLPSNNHLPLTRIVSTLMLNRDGAESLDATFKYFDPRASGKRPAKLQGSFKEAIVFVLGGGTYNEYQNLQDWQKENQQTHGITSVVYGCSELVAPEQFVKQLASMHQAAQQAQRAHMPVD
jgi:hypothetical protein